MLAIFLDTETTGLDVLKHRVIEIAFKIVSLETGIVVSTYQSIVKQSQEVWNKRDPSSVEVNGFTWEKVQTGQEEADVGKEITAILKASKITRGQAVFICQNPSFDRAFFAQLVPVYTQEELLWPYHWLDFASMYWSLTVKELKKNQQPIPKELSLSKNSIATRFNLPIEEHPHSALNGVNHLLLCYQTVVGFRA